MKYLHCRNPCVESGKIGWQLLVDVRQKKQHKLDKCLSIAQQVLRRAQKFQKLRALSYKAVAFPMVLALGETALCEKLLDELPKISKE